jgi:hypothetical protein
MDSDWNAPIGQGGAWTNAEAIAQFRKEHPRKIEEGAELLLPDIDQWFQVVGHMYWKKKGEKHTRVGLVWRSECAVCSAEYEFNTYRKFDYLMRTCPEHRGKWRSPRPAKAVKVAKPKGGKRRGALETQILRHRDDLSVLSDRIGLDLFVKAVVGLLKAPAGRDTRRQSVVRSIQTLVKAGDLHVVDGAVLLA